jgi:hypothetical protein
MNTNELNDLIRTKLLMNYNNNKTLSENILTLKNKLLLEQGDSVEITDKQLKYAYENNCLNTKTNGYKFASYNGKPALALDRSGDPSKKGKELVYVFSDPNNPFQFAYEYVDKTTNKKSGDTKYSECKAFFDKTRINQNPDIEEQIEILIKSKGYKSYEDLTADEKVNYDFVDISTDPMTKKQVGAVGKPFYMWRPKNITQKGLQQQAENLTVEGKKVIDYLKTTEGWVDKPPVGEEQKYFKCDLSNKRPNSINYCYVGDYTEKAGWANYFQGSYILYGPITKFGVPAETIAVGDQYETKIKGITKSTDYNQDDCRELVITYYNLAKYKQDPVKQETGRYNRDKKVIEACLVKFGSKYTRLREIIDYLKFPPSDKTEFQIANYDYTKPPVSTEKKFGFGQIKESELKFSISENLNKVKNQKNNLLIESVIIKERLTKVIEKNEFKTKRDLDRFSFSLLKESAYLNSKGYNENLVAEQWGGILGGLKGFFTGSGFDAIMQYFKEYAVGWMLKTIGLPDTGWLASFVKTAIGNLPLGDIGKLTNCDYTVPFLTKTIVESIIMKLTPKGIDNAFTSVIRNALVDLGESTAFGQAIESGLRTIVCPVVRQLAGKMGTITNNLSAGGNSTTSQPSSSSFMDTAKNLMNTTNSAMSSAAGAMNSAAGASRFTD